MTEQSSGTSLFTSLRDLLSAASRDAGEAPALRFLEEGSAREISYAQLERNVAAFRAGLAAVGLSASPVALLAKSSPESVTALLALLTSPALAIPLAPDTPLPDAIRALRAGDARALLLDEDLYARASETLSRLQNLKIILLPSGKGGEGEARPAARYEDILRRGREALSRGEAREAAPAPDERRLLLFPEGEETEGGVLFSGQNLLAAVRGVHELLPPHKTALSILPLAAPEELTCTLLLSIARRATVCLCPSPRAATSCFKLFRPDFVVLSSLFVERLAVSLRGSLSRSGKWDDFTALARTSERLRRAGIDRRRALFRAVHDTFGGNLRTVLCVGAPPAESSADLFERVGIDLFAGYVFPALAAPAAIARGGSAEEGSSDIHAGKLLPGLRATVLEGDLLPGGETPPPRRGRFFRFLREGEIFLTGDAVAMGLYNNPSGSRALFPRPGTVRTGEFGRLDLRGRLVVTGRRHGLISFKNGKRVRVEEIENLLLDIPYVEDAVVFAEDLRESGEDLRLAARVTLREGTVEDLTRDERAELLRREVKDLNATLPPYKRLRKVRITPPPKADATAE